MADNMTECKPCPFCGSQPIPKPESSCGQLRCGTCGAAGPRWPFDEDDFERWNHRTLVSEHKEDKS